MNDLKNKKEQLKQEIINVLKEKDLTDEVIFIRDEISNFTGTCIDGEVGGLCTKVFITNHTDTEISLMNEFEEELGTFNLNDFGIDFLLTLLD